ncbi:hypothetical protein R3P38DRAFT_2971319 [Favolaschia claudopus]|uniref:F-box domain-containing protein n=1 Tax=Favolaschia claudopus TaxID=2862362 RepID=A0AAW0B267_9AGAR
MHGLQPLPELRLLLRSNEPPSDSQVPTIRNEIATIREQLASLKAKRDEFHRKDDAFRQQLAAMETQMNEAKKEASKLDEEMRAVEEHMHAHFSILSPVRHIPPEILSEIFHWTCSSQWARTVHRLKVYTAPWALTHVCRAWRHVARADAGLWSWIRIDTWDIRLSPSNMSASYPLAALEVQLHLSRTVPLTVEFHVSQKKRKLATTLLQTLVLHSHRWKRFSLKITDVSLIQSLMQIRDRLDSLECLEIGGEAYAESWPLDYADLFSVAPRLREVKLSDRDLEFISPELSFPCVNLTHLRLSCNPPFFFEILRQAPNLVECEVSAWDVPTLIDPAVKLSSLRRLTALELQTTALTSAILAPNLQYLRVTGYIDDIPAFIDSSKCRLSVLKLPDIWRDTHAILPLLQLTPDLLHLELSLCNTAADGVEKVLAALEVSGTSTGLCPKLESMSIIFHDNPRLDLPSYRMIESRFHSQALPGRALRRLRISSGIFKGEGWVDLTEPHLVEIQRFIDEHGAEES